MTDKAETYSDQILEFTLPARSARGRVVRLDSVIDVVLSAHAYPAPITHLLGEALVLAALMGSLLKSEGAQMTMQAQTEEGAVRLLVCDYRAGKTTLPFRNACDSWSRTAWRYRTAGLYH